MNRTILDKLKSRKLWAALVGVVMGIAMVFGLNDTTASTVASNVAGALTAATSIVAYILGEAKVDAAHKRETDEDEN